MGLMDTAINLSNFKENKDLKKTDGKKKSTIEIFLSSMMLTGLVDPNLTNALLFLLREILPNL